MWNAVWGMIFTQLNKWSYDTRAQETYMSEHPEHWAVGEEAECGEVSSPGCVCVAVGATITGAPGHLWAGISETAFQISEMI